VKYSRMTRREMMINGARAVAGLALTTSCRSFGPMSGGRGFKIGVCDWTIGKRTDPASLEMAKRLGLDGVQVDFGGGQDNLPLCNPELQKKFLEAAKKHDVEIASLALGVLNNIPYKSDPRAERWVSESIDVCKAMGVNVVLMAFFGNGDLRNDKKGTDVVVERLKKVAPKAEKAGVFLGFESWLSAEQHLDIIKRIDSPAVKVYYDVANSHKAGYDIYQEIRLLGKQICEFHAKDYDDLYGKGTIAFEEVRRAMDDIGYRGWIVMEGTQMPLGLEDSIRYDAKYLRSVFPPRL
jgi:L-ribulose-5-phosphate 3-epimerase